MKKILIILLFLPAMACMSQSRVVDKSGRKPDWVNGLEKDFIIVAGTGATIQQAQESALNQVRESIVNSVAQNVKATSEVSTMEVNYNNKVSEFLEKFAATVTSSSGPVSYLQGITLAKVDEYYWEKLQDRGSSVAVFNYHIKYPFPNIELQKLVMDFNIRDRQLTEQLDQLLADVENIEQIEDIEKSIGELGILADYFVDARKNRARLGITQYRNLYNMIELVEIESSPGLLKYALRFKDNFIRTSQRPQISSDCARVTGIDPDGQNTVVTYNYYNCYEDPENNLLVKYRFGNTNIQRPFYFDVAADKASVFVNEPVRFSALSVAGNTINSTQVDLIIVSKYEAPFTINKIILEWPGQSPLTIENINRTFQGKGNHDLSITVDQILNSEGISAAGKTLVMLSGYIHYTSDRSGETKTYRLLNHKYTTSW